jgi:putative membrane protein
MPSTRPTTFLRNTGILFLGVLAATWLLDSIQVESTTTLVIVALVLALLNMVIRPVLVLFALPFVVFTLGLGILLINAVLLYLAGQIVPGFEVPTFGTALLGALIISLISLLVNIVLSPRGNVRVRWSVNKTNTIHRSRKTINKQDVIDV